MSSSVSSWTSSQILTRAIAVLRFHCLDRKSHSVKVKRWGEKKQKGRGKEERWLLVQWISEDEELLLKTDEKNAWQLLSLPSHRLSVLCLSLSLPPPHLNLSLPPTSGIYMSYCDWIDCTWEVYLTKQFKVQLVHLDERKWEWERCTASFCLCVRLCLSILQGDCVFLSNKDSRPVWTTPVFHARNTILAYSRINWDLFSCFVVSFG